MEFTFKFKKLLMLSGNYFSGFLNKGSYILQYFITNYKKSFTNSYDYGYNTLIKGNNDEIKFLIIKYFILNYFSEYDIISFEDLQIGFKHYSITQLDIILWVNQFKESIIHFKL